MTTQKKLIPLAFDLELNKNLYLKNPMKTELGKRLISDSVILIDQIGLDQFTFKKLALKMKSAEATIYRYFENKHQLFVYLLNWYWEWLAVRIDFNTLNIKSPSKRLRIVIDVIVDTINRNTSIEYINEEALHRIVVREGIKAYHHKLVDEDNREGFFLSYKSLCGKIAAIIKEISPAFAFSRALASTLIETANNNLYFARHLPRLTDLKADDPDFSGQLKQMLEFFVFGVIHTNMMIESQPDKLFQK